LRKGFAFPKNVHPETSLSAPAGRLSHPAGAEESGEWGTGRKAAGFPQDRAAEPHWALDWASNAYIRFSRALPGLGMGTMRR